MYQELRQSGIPLEWDVSLWCVTDEEFLVFDIRALPQRVILPRRVAVFALSTPKAW